MLNRACSAGARGLHGPHWRADSRTAESPQLTQELISSVRDAGQETLALGAFDALHCVDFRSNPQLLKVTGVCKSAVALFASSLGEHAQILQELDGLACSRLRCLE